MARRIELHPDDDAAIRDVREQLIKARDDIGISAPKLSARLGRSHDFVRGYEKRTEVAPQLSTMQTIAGGLGLRIEFGVENFWLYPHIDMVMLEQYARSRSWGADLQMRVWLVSALRLWRVRKGLDIAQLAPLLSTDVDTVGRWEDRSTDPLISRAMLQARVTQTRVTMRLYSRDEWIYG